MKTVLTLAFLLGAVATNGSAMASTDGVSEAAMPDVRLEAAALTSGRYATAAANLNSASAGAASDPARLINLGNAYAGMGRPLDAQMAYTAAIQAPDSTLMLADGTDASSRAVARRAMARLHTGYAMR